MMILGMGSIVRQAQLVFWLYKNQLPAKRDGHGFKPHTGQLEKKMFRKKLAPRPKFPGDRTHTKNHRFAFKKSNFQQRPFKM